MNIHRKILTTAERDMRLTQKYIKENIDEDLDSNYYFPIQFKKPIIDQGKILDFSENFQKIEKFKISRKKMF